MLLSRIRSAAWRTSVSRSVRGTRTPANPFPNFLTRLEDRTTPTFRRLRRPVAGGRHHGPHCRRVVRPAAGERRYGRERVVERDAVEPRRPRHQPQHLRRRLHRPVRRGREPRRPAGFPPNATRRGHAGRGAGGERHAVANLYGRRGGSPGRATATANSFTAAAAATAGATGTVRLGDLLQATVPGNDFTRLDVNALDVLTGGVLLFNYQNAVATSAPITVSGANLGGLGSVLNSVALQARVVEPPVFVVGPTGTQFHSAAVRLKLDVDLVDIGLDTSALIGPTAAAVPGTTVVATATVGRIQLFADVARGSGSIQTISAITNAVTLQATPSVADVYLGTISDAAFFNRTRPIDVAADLTGGVIGSVAITATTVLNVQLLNLNLGLTAESAALGTAAGPQFPVFTPPFPAYRTIGSSSAVVGNLVTSLVTNLDVRTTGSLGLISTLAGTLNSTLTTSAGTALQPVLTNLLTNLVDPALDGLGVGLGEMDLAVLGTDSPDAAAAANDSAFTFVGRPVTANVLFNDVNPNNLTLTPSISTAAGHGTTTFNADNTVTYTPAAGFLGVDSFAYTLTDAFARTTTATVTVFVATAPTANGAPVVNPDVVNTPAGTAVTVAVLANDTDPNGDALTIIGVGVPAHGTAAVAGVGVAYTPAAGFVGVDHFSYAAGDGNGGVGVATVTVVVGGGTAGNAAPRANPDVIAGPQDKAGTVFVLANDTDADGDALTVVALGQPAHGTAAVNADGSVTYTPAAGFFGRDAFAYTAADGKGGTAGATVSVTIARNNANPVIANDAATTPRGTAVSVNVFANDTDADGDALSISAVTQPAHGSITVFANGTILYSPTAGYVGADAFTYTAIDGFGGSGTATVTLAVTAPPPPPNTAPSINADAASTASATAVTVNVLANDADADGDTLTVTGVLAVVGGAAVVNANGTVTFTPAAGFSGTGSFTYAAADGRGGTGSAGMTVTVARRCRRRTRPR